MRAASQVFTAAVVAFAALAAGVAVASGPQPGNVNALIFPAPEVFAATLGDTRRPLVTNATVMQQFSSGNVLVATGMYDAISNKTSVVAQIFPWMTRDDDAHFAQPWSVTKAHSKSGNFELSPPAVSGNVKNGTLGLFSSLAHEGELWVVTAGGTFRVVVNTVTLNFESEAQLYNLYTPSVTSSAAAINATHFAIVTTRGTSTLQPDSPLALGVFDTTTRKMVGPPGGFYLPAKAVVAAGSCGSAACLFFDEANATLVAVVPGTGISVSLALPLLAGAKVEQVTVAYDAALQRAVVYNWRTVYVVEVEGTRHSISVGTVYYAHLSGGVSVAKLLTRGSLAVGFEADQATGTKAALVIVNMSTRVEGPRVDLQSSGSPADIRLVSTGSAGHVVAVSLRAPAIMHFSPAVGVSAKVEGDRVELLALRWSALRAPCQFPARPVFTADPVTGAQAIALPTLPETTGASNAWSYIELAAGNPTYVLQLGADATADSPPFVLPTSWGATQRSRLVVAPVARTGGSGETVFGWDAFHASNVTTNGPPPVQNSSVLAAYVDPATGTSYWALRNTSSTSTTTAPAMLASSAGLRATLPFTFLYGVDAVFLYPGHAVRPGVRHGGEVRKRGDRRRPQRHYRVAAAFPERHRAVVLHAGRGGVRGGAAGA